MSHATASLPHKHLLTLSLDVDAMNAVQVGETSIGRRTIAAIKGGSFVRNRMKGVVLPGGADWALFQSDRSFQIDVRLTLRTEDKANIYLRYEGRFVGDADALSDLAKGKSLSSDRYSLAITARFECGDPKYSWLNTVVAVGTGEPSGFNPVYALFEIG